MAMNPRKRRRAGGRKRRRVVRHRAPNPMRQYRRRRRTRNDPGPRRRRRNPSRIRIYNRRRRRNPMFGNLQSTLARAAWAIGGGVATRSIPQALLGERNSGLMGYGANLLTAAGGAALISKMAGPVAGESWLLGGVVMIAGRVVEEYFGKKVVEFASVGLPLPTLGQGDPAYDLRMMGDYLNQSFALPYSSLPSGRYLPPAPTPEAAAAANTAKATMGLGQDKSWSLPWN